MERIDVLLDPIKAAQALSSCTISSPHRPACIFSTRFEGMWPLPE